MNKRENPFFSFTMGGKEGAVQFWENINKKVTK
jgi:hypothetical protein